MREPVNQEPGAKTLGEVNANLTAARDAYRKAQAAFLNVAVMARHLPAGHPDGTQELHNANQQVALAAERYEKALRNFIDYRPPSPGEAS